MDMICRKTMTRCLTPGMCSPHGGCQDPIVAELRAVNFDYQLGADAASTEIARLKAENEALHRQVGNLAEWYGNALNEIVTLREDLELAKQSPPYSTRRAAERYRYLRNVAGGADWEYIGHQLPESKDAEVDKLMSKKAGQ